MTLELSLDDVVRVLARRAADDTAVTVACEDCGAEDFTSEQHGCCVLRVVRQVNSRATELDITRLAPE